MRWGPGSTVPAPHEQVHELRIGFRRRTRGEHRGISVCPQACRDWLVGAVGDSGSDEVVRPPFQLIAAAVVAVVGGMVMLPFVSLGAHVLGYLLSSVICFLLTAGFIQVSHRRASRPVDFRPWSASRAVCTTVLGVGFAVACWHAWYIAYELAVA